MKSLRWMMRGAAGVLVLAAAGCGMGKATVAPPVAVATVVEKPGEAMTEEVVSIAATIVKVDKKYRVVTLRDTDGRVFDVHVGDEVKNLPQVKSGATR
jgi:multidrug efflux pump subunit AcrA (membrane-fusion protein)